MNENEIKIISDKIANMWNSWGYPEKREAVKRHLVQYDFQRAYKAIDMLERTSKGSYGPSIADMIEAIESIKTENKTERQHCKTCGDTGWLVVDETGRNSVKQCKDCNGDSICARPCDMPGYNSAGQLIATFDESVAALYRGYMKANPSATNKKAIKKLTVMFPKRGHRLEKMLASGEIASLESDIF